MSSNFLRKLKLFLCLCCANGKYVVKTYFGVFNVVGELLLAFSSWWGILDDFLESAFLKWALVEVKTTIIL